MTLRAKRQWMQKNVKRTIWLLNFRSNLVYANVIAALRQRDALLKNT